MTGPDDPKPYLETPVSEARIAASEVRDSLEAYARLSEPIEQKANQQVGAFDRTQGLIATLIVSLFVGIIIVLTLAYLLAPFSNSADRIMTGTDKARELANTLLLPVVTLVLGYYFGKRAG